MHSTRSLTPMPQSKQATRFCSTPRCPSLWLKLVVASDALSLLIDYADVVRYILGDRT